MPAPPRSRRTAEHRLLVGAVVLGLLALVGLGVFLEPDARGYGTHERLGFAPCLPMERWNVPCPGCGVTTAVTHAAHGELGASLRVQPFGLLLFVGSLGFAGWALTAHLRGRDLWLELRALPRRGWARVGGVVGVLFVAAWVYKLAAVRGWLEVG